MNAAHIHLIFNHIPVEGVPIVLLIFVIAYFKKSQPIFIAGCWVLLLVSLATIPAYIAGDPAKDIVEHYPYFDKAIEGTHEDLAQYALIATLLSGFLALVCLLYDRFRGKLFKPLLVVTTLWVALNVVILLITANYGGKIMHQEIRGGQVTQETLED